MFCNHCGNPIIGNEKYCTKCGSPVGNPYVQTASGNKQSKNKKAVMIGVISFLATMTVILTVLLVYFASADKTTITKITPETDAEVTETTTQIPLSVGDTEFIENELYPIFLNQITEYDCQTYSVKDVTNNFLQWNTIYLDYYGIPDEEGNKKIEGYEAQNNPDPLNIFTNEYDIYVVYSKEKIDYLLINVFNIPEDTVKNTPIEDYIWQNDPTKVDMYYYNGLFYIRDNIYGVEDDYFKVTAVTPIDNGRYEITADNHKTDWLGDPPVDEYYDTYKIIVEPKILNGEKHLSIYSSRRVA